jgi:aminopeptidase
MNNFETNLEKYANLVLKIGVNLQPGQVLFIESPIEAIDFTRKIVKKAYEIGAKYVQVQWDDEVTTKTRFEYANDASFEYYPQWTASMMEQLAESGGAMLNIKVPDPELYKGIESAKVTTATKAAATAREKFQGYVRNHMFSWCLVKAPTKAWAAMVYPEIPEEQRIETMWDMIFQINRVYAVDPVAAWQEHIEKLKKIEQMLNAKKYKKLHYHAPGTALTVELPEGHLWLACGEKNERGIHFVANMPTEEVFTMPKRDGVNGTVASTKPLNLNGRIVDKLSLTFKDGKIIDFSAEVGYEHLKSLLDTDEGAKYLGEVALVQHDSPISNLNRIFYNTGVDENASCHFAIGSAYPVNIENGTKVSKEELLRKGGNVSLTHVDFMIGSSELEIVGELADGTLEPLFRKGNWAI